MESLPGSRHPPTVTGDLAGRWPRFVARVIDAVPLIGASSFGGASPVIAGLYLMALVAIISIQVISLSKTGRSIGKKVMSLKVVRIVPKTNESDYDRFVNYVFLRELVNGIVSIIPIYWLIDTLLIFRKDRRCLHDFMAGTWVVRAVEPA